MLLASSAARAAMKKGRKKQSPWKLAGRRSEACLRRKGSGVAAHCGGKMAAIGRDSSGQEGEKKHAVGKADRRRGGHEVPRGFEPAMLDSESSRECRVRYT